MDKVCIPEPNFETGGGGGGGGKRGKVHCQTLVTVMAMFKGLFLCSFLGLHYFQLSSGVIMKYFKARMVLSEKSLQ